MLALIPIILVLILSLKTKNIYFALVLGIISALFIFCGFDPLLTLEEFINVFAQNASDNMDILIYVSFLGMFIYLINSSGAAHYFASKVINKLKTKRQTTIVAMLLGIMCFLDDYFNCLTVNTVMKPIADRNGMSREKLAYIVDATASPICVLTPISSWAGLVGASLPAISAINGFGLYVKTIPFNFYPILTIVFITALAYFNFDFGRMKKLEDKAEQRNKTKYLNNTISQQVEINTRARTFDLISPIIVLTLVTSLMMVFTGGLFEGKSITEAFMNCEAVKSLASGTFITILYMAALYLPRKVMKPKEFLDGITNGFEFISTSILILLLAWVFSTVCGSDYLNFTGWVADLINSSQMSFALVPFILFIVCFLVTMATGVSWAAIALLIPLASILFNDTVSPLMILSTAAIISGGAAGDHIGPLSDTTILSATISEANYTEHVISQFQYGIIVVIISSLGYLISGISGLYWLGLIFGLVLTPLVLFIIKHMQIKRS